MVNMITALCGYFSGTFVSDTGGTFKSDTPGTFVSDIGGTFEVILSTRIGCGIAGFTDAEIAPLFMKARSLNNVRIPESFDLILNEMI